MAGCRADADSSSQPPVVQPSEVNSAEPDGAPAGAPSPAALQDPPHSIRTTAECFWSNCLPTKNKAWKLQPLNNTYISLCTLRSVTSGQGWRSRTCQALNSTPHPSATYLEDQYWQRLHRFDLATASQNPTSVSLDSFMVNPCKSKAEFSLQSTQGSQPFYKKISPISRTQRHLMFLPPWGQCKAVLCYEAWLQAKPLWKQTTKAFVNRERLTKPSKSPGSASLSVQVLSRASTKKFNARQWNFRCTIKDLANKSIQV